MEQVGARGERSGKRSEEEEKRDGEKGEDRLQIVSWPAVYPLSWHCCSCQSESPPHVAEEPGLQPLLSSVLYSLFWSLDSLNSCPPSRHLGGG
ncbi:hypothetical protein PAMP_018438 [Pampus punctatissimus]